MLKPGNIASMMLRSCIIRSERDSKSSGMLHTDRSPYPKLLRISTSDRKPWQHAHQLHLIKQILRRQWYNILDDSSCNVKRVPPGWFVYNLQMHVSMVARFRKSLLVRLADEIRYEEEDVFWISLRRGKVYCDLGIDNLYWTCATSAGRGFLGHCFEGRWVSIRKRDVPGSNPSDSRTIQGKKAYFFEETRKHDASAGVVSSCWSTAPPKSTGVDGGILYIQYSDDIQIK